MKRIALFGGMFDPPHKGHVALVASAIATCNLNHVFVVVTAAPPHKKEAVASIEERMEMTRLAFAEHPDAEVVDWESHPKLDGTPTYTVDTLEKLKKEFPEDELLLIIGADQLVALRQWFRWQDVIRLATIAVGVRPGVSDSEFVSALQELEIVGARVTVCTMEPVDIDSTNIRSNAARGDVELATQDVPKPVTPDVEAIYTGTDANSMASGVH